MSAIYLVWNQDRTECVGFADKSDAEQAAGILRAGGRTGGGVSTLAEFFRDNYADEDIFDDAQEIFDIQEILV